MLAQVQQTALNAQADARNQNAAMLGSVIQSAGAQLGNAYAQSKQIQWKASEAALDRQAGS